MSPRRPLLLLDAYVDAEGAPYYLPWFEQRRVQTIHVTRAPIDVSPGDVAGVVISGSKASVNDPDPWIGDVAAWVRAAVEEDVPVLGCCFGHQMVAHACLGKGAVVRMERAEVGYPEVTIHRPDPLVEPLGPSLAVFASHEDEVVVQPGLEVLASSPACAVHAMRIRGHRAWGVQFHVEYPPDEEARILRYRAERHPELGLDPDALLRRAPDTARTARLLFTQFLDLVDGVG